MATRSRLSRRRFLALAAAGVSGAALAACGNAPASQGSVEASTAASEAAAASQAAPEAVAASEAAAPSAVPAVARMEGKLTIWSPGDNGTVLDWNSDPILQKVQEATGVQINMVRVSWDTYADQVNAAIASGEMPDLVCCIDTGNRLLIDQWVRDGVVAPFEGPVAAAAPNVLAQYEQNATLNEL